MNVEQRDEDVLAVLADTGETTTSTLRERISWMETPAQSSYRIDKLEDLGLVETTEGVQNGQPVTRKVDITIDGIVYVDTHNIKHERLSLEQRVERLESEKKQMKRRMNAQQEVIDAYQTAFDTVGIEIDVKDIMLDVLDD